MNDGGRSSSDQSPSERTGERPGGEPGRTAQSKGRTDASDSPKGPESRNPGEGRTPGGGSAPSPRGGGATERDGADDGGGEAAPDDSKADPKHEPSPPENFEDTVAPDQPQSDLVLRKLRDVLDKNEVTPDLEKDMGMTRAEMEQFVRKFEKQQAAQPGPGREVEIKPGDGSAGSKPSKGLSGIDRNTSFSNRTSRNPNTMSKDEIRDNVEGVRFEVPSELRSKYEGYVNRLSRSRGAAARPPQPNPQAPPSSR